MKRFLETVANARSPQGPASAADSSLLITKRDPKVGGSLARQHRGCSRWEKVAPWQLASVLEPRKPQLPVDAGGGEKQTFVWENT